MGRVTHYKTQREFFENEWFPTAYSIGVSWKEFWSLNPHIIKCMMKGHEEKKKAELKEKDYLAWMSGHYTMSAVFSAFERALNGKKAKTKYIEKPLLEEAIEYAGLTQEEIDEREMRKEIAAMEAWIANDKRRGLPETKIL